MPGWSPCSTIWFARVPVAGVSEKGPTVRPNAAVVPKLRDSCVPPPDQEIFSDGQVRVRHGGLRAGIYLATASDEARRMFAEV